jgi:hypothetical protein
MRRTFLSGAIIAATVGFVAGACDEEVTPPEPVPGTFVVSLISPSGAEGAVILETTDEGILSAASEAGQAFFWRGGDTSRIVVILDEPGAVRFTIEVEDVNAPPELEIVEVADGANALREDLTGYEVVLEAISAG